MSEKKYSHVFIDLDQTLWDFSRNSEDVKEKMFIDFNIDKLAENINYSNFHDEYSKINTALWALYTQNKIDKHTLNFLRFNDTLKALNIFDDKLGGKMADYYIEEIGNKTYFFNGAIELLEYLNENNYSVNAITNGFEEIVEKRFSKNDLDKYFSSVITSKNSKSLKPMPEIFYYAMKISDANVDNSIMIGDNFEIDIIGAKNVGIDQIWLNNYNIELEKDFPTYEVKQLSEIKNIL